MIIDDVDVDGRATRKNARYVSIQINGVSVGNDIDTDPKSAHMPTPFRFALRPRSLRSERGNLRGASGYRRAGGLSRTPSFLSCSPAAYKSASSHHCRNVITLFFACSHVERMHEPFDR